MNFALANARSVAAKLPSLIDMFVELDLNLVMLTETWFYKSDRQLKQSLTEIRDEAGLVLIRKDSDSL